ncbi:hypothetical protein GCM10025867_39280 [Frondihabitans sucicola]|uniref:DUF222 domain-containing protein n=1 Tax=Frondihabitans sucicola TaxID=1268041 RepID=A0ABM8GT95_9MICO|nr:hypothetical protein GCM10025867_39280 [Frondihabitans sucicola]
MFVGEPLGERQGEEGLVELAEVDADEPELQRERRAEVDPAADVVGEVLLEEAANRLEVLARLHLVAERPERRRELDQIAGADVERRLGVGSDALVDGPEPRQGCAAARRSDRPVAGRHGQQDPRPVAPFRFRNAADGVAKPRTLDGCDLRPHGLDGVEKRTMVEF